MCRVRIRLLANGAILLISDMSLVVLACTHLLVTLPVHRTASWQVGPPPCGFASRPLPDATPFHNYTQHYGRISLSVSSSRAEQEMIRCRTGKRLARRNSFLLPTQLFCTESVRRRLFACFLDDVTSRLNVKMTSLMPPLFYYGPSINKTIPSLFISFFPAYEMKK